jgi:hypothetical protein
VRERGHTSTMLHLGERKNAQCSRGLIKRVNTTRSSKTLPPTHSSRQRVVEVKLFWEAGEKDLCRCEGHRLRAVSRQR